MEILGQPDRLGQARSRLLSCTRVRALVNASDCVCRCGVPDELHGLWAKHSYERDSLQLWPGAKHAGLALSGKNQRAKASAARAAWRGATLTH